MKILGSRLSSAEARLGYAFVLPVVVLLLFLVGYALVQGFWNSPRIGRAETRVERCGGSLDGHLTAPFIWPRASLLREIGEVGHARGGIDLDGHHELPRGHLRGERAPLGVIFILAFFGGIFYWSRVFSGAFLSAACFSSTRPRPISAWQRVFTSASSSGASTFWYALVALS